MQGLRYKYIIIGCIFALLFAGCSPDEGDLTPPDATVDGVESPRTDTSIILSGTVEEGALILVEIGFGSTAVITNLTQGGGFWSCTAINMSEGLNTFYVYANDFTGNTLFIQVPIIVDLTGPTVTLDQYVTPTPNGSQVLAGTVGDLDANDVQVSIDGGGSWSSVDDINGGIWTYAVNLAASVTPYDVQVKGVDNLLNETDLAEYATASIDVDVAADVITITEAMSGPVYISTPDVTSTILLNGARTATYSVDVNSVIPVSSVVIDDSTDPVNWTADFLSLPPGNTIAAFGLNDLSVPDPVEVAQASIMVIRDLSGPELIAHLPVHGAVNVPTIDPLVLTFSETMAPIVNDGTFINIVDENENIITFSTDPSPSADLRTFSFNADLATPVLANTKYTVNFLISATMTVTDEFGNELVRPTDLWTFATQ